MKPLAISEYDYELPEHRIARYPLENREGSRLIIVKPGLVLEEKGFADISSEIPPGSLVVTNNTRVIHARLAFTKPTGAAIEIFCLSPVDPDDYHLTFSARKCCIWSCLVGNLKKWKEGCLEQRVIVSNLSVKLVAFQKGIDNQGNPIVQFSWDKDITFGEILEVAGKMPIPPYLCRDTETIDHIRYQTVYGKASGSVAAPTAGLHFTKDILDELSHKGISLAELTLHVGAGTFQPVKTTNALDHAMHGEQIIVSKKILDSLAGHSGPVIATGTTSLRSLESIYWLGVKIIKNQNPASLEQWYWRENSFDISRQDSIRAISEYLEREKQDFLTSTTQIMVVPGYRFRMADALITNFHQPKSTLLLLIAAFIGDRWKEVYRYALAHNFRFLSYGDSSLLWLHHKI